MRRLLGRLIRALLWSLAAVLIALGAAGVVAGGDQPAGDATRPELTWREDALMAPRIEALRGGLIELLSGVTQLTTVGRQTLVDLTARDQTGLGDDLDTGDAIVVALETRSQALEQDLAALPFQAGSYRISADTSAALRTIEDAARSVRPLAGDWGKVSSAALPAIQLTALLTQHDQQAFTAIKSGTAGRYAGALTGLATALKTLDAAKAIRDQLAPVADVSTIDDWMTRNRTYDQALVQLYTLLRDSGGRVTSAVRTAFAAVQRAQQALPADTSALVVIVGDIAQAGLTQALVDIDTARGALVTAATTLH